MHCSCYKEAPKNACLKCIQIIFYKKKKISKNEFIIVRLCR